MYYGSSYFSDNRIRSNHFILSNVNVSFLRRNKITMKLEDFKTLVRKTQPAFIVMTGGAGFSRHTKVYDINQFKKYQNQEVLL